MLLIISCEVYFPDTVEPVQTVNNRTTPAGVIKQLFNSYNSRNINLFTQILWSDSFKFYISPDFDRTQLKNPGILLSERADSFMVYVNTTSLFYYWNYNAELTSTKNLFNRASDLKVGSSYFIYDPVYKMSDTGDTLYAEVKVEGISIDISYEGMIYVMENQPQVFLMKRDSENLWVIWKWYDLSSDI